MTPFEDAVEELVNVRLGCGPTCKDEHRDESLQARRDLTRALPHLRRMMAEELLTAKPPRDGTGTRKIRVDAWEDAADHLTRKEVP